MLLLLRLRALPRLFPRGPGTLSSYLHTPLRILSTATPVSPHDAPVILHLPDHQPISRTYAPVPCLYFSGVEDTSAATARAPTPRGSRCSNHTQVGHSMYKCCTLALTTPAPATVAATPDPAATSLSPTDATV
ncbi:hypothetical protein C8R44DRAFT_980627 [Mycena epipterygia]|nr:hypothetical protein C8R44DRAFT_980627 [Mycena epipterygia]